MQDDENHPRRHWVEDLRFSIEHFDRPHGNLVEVLGRLTDLSVAKAAFRAAIEQHPGKIIWLCQKARVIARSDEDPDAPKR